MCCVVETKLFLSCAVFTTLMCCVAETKLFLLCAVLTIPLMCCVAESLRIRARLECNVFFQIHMVIELIFMIFL